MRRPLGWRERKAPVKDHKTAVTGGPAKLVVDKDMKTTMDAYLEYRRGRGSSEKLLVSHRGTPSSKLPTLVQAFARSYGVDIPTPSLHRKVIGSRAVSLLEEKQAKVCGLMAQSMPTQKRYYRALEDKQHTVEAFEAISTPNNPDHDSETTF